MKNEETHLINDEIINTEVPVKSTPKKKSFKDKTIVAAAGGFATGATVGTAASVMASNHDAEVNDDIDKQEISSTETPEPEDVILANDEGVRVAHVEADSFSDAFAQAREQLGPGGVFEYEGKIYGTYYANEWKNMSNQERADFQNRVNEVTSDHHSSSAHHNAPTHRAASHQPNIEHQENSELEGIHNEELISEQSVNNEVRVLGVETVQTEDGSIMNVALLENGEDRALMVDVNDDGMIEVFIHDDNDDGQIQDNEVHDIADAEIHVNDLLMVQAAQEGDDLYGSDDIMPDYNNDVDSIMEV